MKELVPIMWDDLDLAEKDVKTPADETHTIALDGTKAELDLTAEHARELTVFLSRYLQLRRKRARQVASGAYKYQFDPRDVRTFADARGLPYKTPRGDYYYGGALLASYDAWKAGGDWRKAYDEWVPPKPHGRKRGEATRAEKIGSHDRLSA